MLGFCGSCQCMRRGGGGHDLLNVVVLFSHRSQCAHALRDSFFSRVLFLTLHCSTQPLFTGLNSDMSDNTKGIANRSVHNIVNVLHSSEIS